jgi:GTP1/Obg family GTP-binding protein
MKAAMYTTFEDTKLDDKEERHELWQRMQLMKQFQGRFESILKQGAKAKQTLTLLDRAKQLIG